MTGRMDVSPDEVISRGDVTLRRYRPDDLDTVLQAVTDSADHLRPWMPWAASYDRADAAEFLPRRPRTGPTAPLTTTRSRPGASWPAAAA